MAITAYTGPLVAFGQASGSDNNPDAPAPQMFADGVGLLDTRDPFIYQPGAAANHTFYGYLGGEVVLVDQAPSAIAVDNIAAAAALTIATPMTLVSTSGAGITVGASVVNALTGVAATGLGRVCPGCESRRDDLYRTRPALRWGDPILLPEDSEKKKRVRRAPPDISVSKYNALAAAQTAEIAKGDNQ